jgi:hypothetical protein
MDKVSIIIQMEPSMREIGYKINSMVKVKNAGQMEQFMREIM